LNFARVNLGLIIFGSVRFLSKKVTKPKKKIFEKKNRNRVKPTGFGSVRFFRAKTGSARFFRFGSVFFWFFVGFGSVRFFQFFGYKTETEPAGFFKNLIGFFFGSVFLVIFFPIFSV
jgi:hypothetical protein